VVEVKLSDFSGIYWSYLLNCIDFGQEISDHTGSLVSIKTRQAKYLISLNFLGSGLD